MLVINSRLCSLTYLVLSSQETLLYNQVSFYAVWVVSSLGLVTRFNQQIMKPLFLCIPQKQGIIRENSVLGFQ